MTSDSLATQEKFTSGWADLAGNTHTQNYIVNTDHAATFDINKNHAVNRETIHMLLTTRAVPNILFVFYSVRIVGWIVYSYSAE